MKTKTVLLILLAGLLLASDATARVFVATNSSWRYFKGTSEASNPTNAWRELAFDDSAWLTGAAPFHYGTNAVGGDDNLTGGTILSDMRSNFTCVFLRQTFVIDDTNSVRGLWANLWFDDGFGIWINGQRARNPVYVGSLAYTNTATTSHEANPLTRADISGAISSLRPGTNVLCLQAFNRSLTDDDSRIEVELTETPSSLALASSTATAQENDGQVALRVMRTNDLGAVVTVDYATTNGTALAGQDYVATNGTLTFAQDQTEQTIAVPILNDGMTESTENFQVKLSNPGGGGILGATITATVQITDSDKPLQLELASYSINEDAGAITIRVLRRDDGDFPVAVDFATANLTAVAGQDYLDVAGTLNFASGETLKKITVTLLNDAAYESSETFRLTLSNPAGGAVLGSPSSANVNITNTDNVVQFQAAGFTNREDSAFARVAVVRGESALASTVGFATANGTAVAGQDYTGVTNTLSFAPGERLKFIEVPMLNDAVKEGSETFRITLSTPTGGTVLGSPATATVTIADNDSGVGFTRSVFSVWTNMAVAKVDVLRGRDDLLSAFTVDYRTVNGSAQTGVDYQAASGTLSFEANQTLEAITIPLLQNPAATGQKYFTVTLSNATAGIPLGTATTRVNIFYPSGYYPIVPWIDAKPRLGRENSMNLLSWEGDGVLERADRVTGPWENLAQVSSPYATRSSLPMGFYRIQHSPRPTEVYVPSRYDGQTPLPLLVVLHGYSGDAAWMKNYFLLQPAAESRGLFLCYPEGTQNTIGYRFWNATDACCNFYGSEEDDSAYLRDVIEEIAQRFAVDRKRIYVTGLSNGGYMSHRMACDHADLIAGIASFAGTTFLDPDSHRPSQPVHVLQIHGTADEGVPYDGGAIIGLPLAALFPGAVKTVQTWARLNDCQGAVADPHALVGFDPKCGRVRHHRAALHQHSPRRLSGVVDHQRGESCADALECVPRKVDRLAPRPSQALSRLAHTGCD